MLMSLIGTVRISIYVVKLKLDMSLVQSLGDQSKVVIYRKHHHAHESIGIIFFSKTSIKANHTPLFDV